MSWRELSIIMALASIAFSLLALFYNLRAMNSMQDYTWKLPVNSLSNKVSVRRRCRRTLNEQESEYLRYAVRRSKEFVAAPTFVRFDYNESTRSRTLVFCRGIFDNYSSNYYEVAIPQGLFEDFENGVYDVYDLQRRGISIKKLNKLLKK